MNMNSYFQETYFRKRAFNNIPNIQLDNPERYARKLNDQLLQKSLVNIFIWYSLKKDNYERVIEAALANATVLNHKVSPCQESFIPDVTVT